MRSQQFSMFCRSAILAGVTFAGVHGAAAAVMAQTLKDVQAADTPLVLKAQGSFFVGGEKVEQSADVILQSIGEQVRKGKTETMMAGFDGRIPDADIWGIVNYLRTLPPKK